MLVDFITSLTINELMLLIPFVVTLNIALLGMYHLTVLDRRIKQIDNTLLHQARNAMILSVLTTMAIALSGISTPFSNLFFSVLGNALTSLFIYQIYESNFSENKKAIHFNRKIFIPLIVLISIVCLFWLTEPEQKWLRGRSTQLLLMYLSVSSIYLGIKHWHKNNSAQQSLTTIWIVTVILFVCYVSLYTPEIPPAAISLSFLILTTTLLLGFLLASVSSLNLKLIKQISDLSEIDSLTGLNNRRYFLSHVDALISLSNRQNQPCSVAIIDLDDFKKINDTYGHDVGDKVLQAFSIKLKQEFRDNTLIARWGGEEFLLFFPMTNLSGANEAIQRFKGIIDTFELNLDGIKISITFSVGLSDCSSADAIDSAIKEADSALYQAKFNGKNQLKISNG